MSRGYQNLHTHTTYCDGLLSAEEMIIAAIEKGGGSIGFSEHSYVAFEHPRYSMMPSLLPQYMAEINSLKIKYADDIDVFLGVEQDIFSGTAPDGLDYVIGSVHHIKAGDGYTTVDGSYDYLHKGCQDYFNGDYLSLVEEYYKTIAEVAVKTGADIIGHFDLVVKHNTDNKLFDPAHPRYLQAAVNAMEEILCSCRIFEVNTGVMYRKGRLEPYPSETLLRELSRRGAEIILTSDSHDAASLYYKYDEMKQYVNSCGFRYIKRLTKNGFIDEKI